MVWICTVPELRVGEGMSKPRKPPLVTKGKAFPNPTAVTPGSAANRAPTASVSRDFCWKVIARGRDTRAVTRLCGS